MRMLLAALLLFAAAQDAPKPWEYQAQSIAPKVREIPGRPLPPAESEVTSVTLTYAAGKTSEFSSPKSTAKWIDGAVSFYENEACKLEFKLGEVKITKPNEPARTLKLKAAPIAVVVETRESDLGYLAHLVRTEQFKKLEKSKTLQLPVYRVNFNTFMESEIQVALTGTPTLEGTKGKIKTRRFELILEKSHWYLYVDENDEIIASKTITWVRGEERYRTYYLGRKDQFASPQVKEVQ